MSELERALRKKHRWFARMSAYKCDRCKTYHVGNSRSKPKQRGRG